jgi:hypothetical protein
LDASTESEEDPTDFLTLREALRSGRLARIQRGLKVPENILDNLDSDETARSWIVGLRTLDLEAVQEWLERFDHIQEPSEQDRELWMAAAHLDLLCSDYFLGEIEKSIAYFATHNPGKQRRNARRMSKSGACARHQDCARD